MKTRFILLILLSLIVFSCNDDDDGSAVTPIPEEEKFIETITYSNMNYQFEYNEDKTVKSLIVSNLILFEYTYENGRMSAITLIANGQAIDYFLEYDANDKISSFTNNGVITPVIYNAEENYYKYEKEDGNEFSLYLTENGDVYKTINYDPVQDDEEGTVSIYENSKMGVLTNTSNIKVPSVLVLGENIGVFYLFPVSRKPIKTLSISGGVVTFENIYDGQDFISQSILSVDEEDSDTVKYNYVQL